MSAGAWYKTVAPVPGCPVCAMCAPGTQRGTGAAGTSGGSSDWRAPSAEIAPFIPKIKKFIEPTYKFDSFVAVGYKTQVVSGTNYTIRVQADDFLATFELYQPLAGPTQIKTRGGMRPLDAAGSCPVKCANYGLTSQGRAQKVSSCGKYISRSGWCGNAADWGPSFLENAAWGPMLDCRSCP